MRRLSEEQVTLITRRARAIADPTRVRILDALGRGEQPVGQIAAAIETEPSTVSKHLQVLFHAGLVQRRREASAVIYSLSDPETLEWCRYFCSAQLAPRTSRL